MDGTTVLWAGRALSDEEAARARRMSALLRRLGDAEGAAELERYLPGSEHAWTPDELELGAHAGPWLEVDGGPAGPSGDQWPGRFES